MRLIDLTNLRGQFLPKQVVDVDLDKLNEVVNVNLLENLSAPMNDEEIKPDVTINKNTTFNSTQEEDDEEILDLL